MLVGPRPPSRLETSKGTGAGGIPFVESSFVKLYHVQKRGVTRAGPTTPSADFGQLRANPRRWYHCPFVVCKPSTSEAPAFYTISPILPSPFSYHDGEMVSLLLATARLFGAVHHALSRRGTHAQAGIPRRCWSRPFAHQIRPSSPVSPCPEGSGLNHHKSKHHPT